MRLITLADGETVHNAILTKDLQIYKGSRVKLQYYPATDSLYVELKPVLGVETREISDGVIVDLDGDGQAVGFDIDHASRRLDLSTIETEALPLRSTRNA